MISRDGDDCARRTANRRELLAAGAASVAVGGLFGPLSAAASAGQGALGGPSINGRLTRVEQDALVLEDCHVSRDWAASGLRSLDGSTAVVAVDGDTSLYRDGGAQLRDFVPGDRLIAQIRPGAGKLKASAVEPVYVGIDDDVVSRRGNRLSTSAGTVVVTDRTRIARSASAGELRSFRDMPAAVRRGILRQTKHVRAMCRFDPSSRQFVAAILADPETP